MKLASSVSVVDCIYQGVVPPVIDLIVGGEPGGSHKVAVPHKDHMIGAEFGFWYEMPEPVPEPQKQPETNPVDDAMVPTAVSIIEKVGQLESTVSAQKTVIGFHERRLKTLERRLNVMLGSDDES